MYIRIAHSTATFVEKTSTRVDLPTGVSMHYVARNTPAGAIASAAIARALVLVHGYSDSWRSFEDVLDRLPLEVSGVPIFAVDLRGHGTSSEAPSASYDVQDFADDLAAFMDARRIMRAVVVGHSMGGLVAQQFAAAYPEKVERLVLLSTFATLAGWPGLADLEGAVHTFADDAPAPIAFIREFQASTFHLPPPPRVLERFVSESLQVKGRIWKKSLAGMTRADPHSRLHRITAPTQILWGERDAFFGRDTQEELLRLIPQAELTTYPETGHALNVERSIDIARLLEHYA